MKIELALFDLAGTTVKDNKDVHRVLQSALAHHGVSISIEDANTVMGIPKPVAIRALLAQRDSSGRPVTEAWIDEIHRLFVKEMIQFYEEDRPITAPLLRRLGWIENGLVDASVTSDEVPRGRPYPDLAFKAMSLTGVTHAHSVAKVGDTVSDLEEGNAAGCGLVIGVTTGAFTAQELSQSKHSFLIERIPQVLDIIKNHG
jgi:phosphoglycolate phosphatase-like HAD superfamily hydrolase